MKTHWLWGSLQSKALGVFPKLPRLVAVRTSCATAPTGSGVLVLEKQSAEVTAYKTRRSVPARAFCCSWRERLSDLLQLDLLNIALSYEAREWQTNSQLALGRNQQCQEHQRQQQPLISNITGLQIIICSKDAAPFSSREGEAMEGGQERNGKGCSHMLQSEDSFVFKTTSFVLQELRSEGRGRALLLSASIRNSYTSS